MSPREMHPLEAACRDRAAEMYANEAEINRLKQRRTELRQAWRRAQDEYREAGMP